MTAKTHVLLSKKNIWKSQGNKSGYRNEGFVSLIGIDVGSSSVKIAAYQEDGKLLTVANNEIEPLHPKPGWWETDPENVWQATKQGLVELVNHASVRKDPPNALAISASGRENFPADKNGNPLGNNMMGADIRGEEFEISPQGAPSPEPWSLSCGHLRERMDPVFRLQWWRKYHPEIIDKTKYYPDWHGFLTMRFCGRNVSEPSLVARWCAYDLQETDWSKKDWLNMKSRKDSARSLALWIGHWHHKE